MAYSRYLVLALLSAVVLPAAAEQQTQPTMPHKMPGMTMPNMNMQTMNAAQKEFHMSMQKMNQEMMHGMMDSDPGISWLKQMIAHHQGAVDMADIVLKHSKDEQVRKEARKTRQQNEKDSKELEATLRRETKGRKE